MRLHDIAGGRAVRRFAVLLPAVALATMVFAPAARATPIGAPTISNISPTIGPAGTIVTVTGTHFTGATLVEFAHATAIDWSVLNDSTISVKVPVGALIGGIGVQTAGGYAGSAQTFEIISVVSTAPASAPVGAVVRVLGLTIGGATRVTFNGVPARFTVMSGTRIDATIPVGATTGPIAVATPNGTAVSTFDFPVGPTVSGFSPGAGPAGTAVLISGSALNGATTVRFGLISAPFTVLSPTQVRATVPVGATSGPISVTTPAWTATSAASFAVGLAPAISGFSPMSGRRGSVVTISGANLAAVTGVTIGGAAAAFRILSPTTVASTVPYGARTGTITVTSAAGSAVSALPFYVMP